MLIVSVWRSTTPQSGSVGNQIRLVLVDENGSPHVANLVGAVRDRRSMFPDVK